MSMTERKDEGEDAFLETYFEAGRSAAPEPPTDLMVRIAAAAELAPASVPRRRGRLSIAAVLGGWPGIAGLATATAAGVFLGVAAPQMLDLVVPGGSGVDLGAFQPGYGVFLGDSG